MESTDRSRSATPTTRSNLISAALLPVGLFVLLFFDAQVVLTPFALVIEWILARVAKSPVKIAWSLIAGVLAGEYVYLLIGLTEYNGALGVVAGMVVATIVAFVYLATTRGPAAGRADDL